MNLAPPVAQRRPHRLEAHGDVREDPYYWLREQGSDEVVAYLEAENAYGNAYMAQHEEFVERLFKEVQGRIPQEDEGVPFLDDDGWWYSWRIAEDDQYPTYFRARDGAEQVLIDLNEVAEAHDFVSLTGYACPKDTHLMWYTLDLNGDGQGQLLARDVRRQESLEFKALANAEFSRVADFAVVEGRDDALWFVTEDPETLRPDSLWFWRVGDDRPTLVMREKDQRFGIGVGKTADRKYLVINVGSHVTDEIWIADARSVKPDVRILFARQHGVELDVDHHGTHWYVATNLSNEGATHRNYEVVVVPEKIPTLLGRRILLPHREDVLVEGFEIFQDHMVISEKHEGISGIYVYDLEDGAISNRRQVPFPESVIECGLGDNHRTDTHVVRVGYESPTTPAVVYDCDMRTMQLTELKRQKVLGDFDHSRYEARRVHATAPDGTAVPVTVVRHKDTPLDGSAPCWLTGYGAYGLSYELYFVGAMLSLLDRGFVYAIAHVRGGSELGKPWHDSGKMEHKANTFTDFVACAEHLIAEGVSSPERLCVEGRSAGGLLMGVVANMRPDLFKVVFAGVPFVDVVTTMLDENMPLVVGEFEEWGNPARKDDYDRMLAYSPYDNVEAKEYPAMLVRTSIHDSAVMYWEPAKWVAKLRATKTDDNPIVFLCDMKAGHKGSSGRFDKYREVATNLAFVCAQVGITS